MAYYAVYHQIPKSSFVLYEYCMTCGEIVLK